MMKPLLKGCHYPDLLFADSEQIDTLRQRLHWPGWKVSEQLQIIPFGIREFAKNWLIGNLRDQNLLNTDYTDGHGKSTDFFGVFREIPCNP